LSKLTAEYTYVAGRIDHAVYPIPRASRCHPAAGLPARGVERAAAL
jgi:hypothetical protein